MLKTCLNICLLVCCAWFSSMAQIGDPVLNTRVKLPIGEYSKSNIIDSLSQNYKLYFSYNPIQLNASKAIRTQGQDLPLYEAIQLLIEQTQLSYKVFDNQIVLFQEEKEVEKSDAKYLIIKGIVNEAYNNTPVAYCNISLVGKQLGTITNLEGRFAVKIPYEYETDTLGFSSLGYQTKYLPIAELISGEQTIQLKKRTYKLRSIDVVRYDPYTLLEKADKNYTQNYETDYTLYTTFYRELTRENTEYVDISEAVLQIMKAPYDDKSSNDNVKFIKGRKAAKQQPLNDIQFKLKGGPYYITKLDVVKNRESFLNSELRHLYTFEFEKTTSIDNLPAAIISFKPISNLRDILFEGNLYIDLETYAIARVEFQYTKQGLKASHNSLILKEPKKHRVIADELSYVIQYKYHNAKWYLLTARSSFHIRINNREKRERTRFHSIAELLTTNIEKGDFQKFSHKEIFRSNEIFTDKIISYDKAFWENYNTIRAEENLEKAIKDFDKQNLMIIYRN